MTTDPTAEASSEAPDSATTPSEAAAPAPVVEATEAETSKKKPGPLRWWAVILIPLVIGGLIAAIEWGLAPWVAGQLRSSLAAGDLELADDTAVAASAIGSSLRIDLLKALDPQSTDNPVPYAIDEITADLALWDTISSGNLIIDRLAAVNADVSLRRRPDGTLPGVSPEVIPPKPPAEEATEPKDWLALYEDISRWHKTYEDWNWVLGREEGSEPKPEPVPAPGWENATFYTAPPAADEPSPRFLIREAAISGERLEFPDQILMPGDASQAGAFDLKRFALTGSNLTNRLEAGEQQAAVLEAESHGAGSWKLDLERVVGEGRLGLAWSDLPVALLADEQVAGSALAKYRPTGVASLGSDVRWAADGLSGTITISIVDLQLDPTAEAEAEAHEVATFLKENPISPITWNLEVSGTLSDPRITGFGLEPLLEAAKQALIDKGKRLAQEKLDEEAGKLKDKLKDSLGDKLKDKVPGGEDAAGGAVDSLKDKAGGLLGGLGL